MSDFRSGFVALVGRPNVGKSTLLNRLVGKDISITAPRPQTTRNRVLGVKHGPDWQAVLLDTPGIHPATDLLNQRMVGYAAQALADADVVVLLVEPFEARYNQPGPQDTLALEMVKKAGRPALLVINKMDAAPQAQLEATYRWYEALELFRHIVPLSALRGIGLTGLLELLPQYLPPGPAYFPPDQTTDQAETTLIAEMIRQEVFRLARQEVPYATAVKVDQIKEDDKLMTIHASILVERDSQKGILIGAQGKMLKTIGSQARHKLEKLFGTHIFLALHVAILKDWSQSPRHLDALGYRKEK